MDRRVDGLELVPYGAGATGGAGLRLVALQHLHNRHYLSVICILCIPNIPSGDLARRLFPQCKREQ